ncbi:3',5'-cyclic-nucleotide phosphodiesterase pde1, partial [Oleoguttula sp. CCFEE 5521]
MSDDGDGRNTSAPAVGGGPVTAHIYGHGADNPPRESRSRKRKPALQVICLGESGGPSEENVTAFLVRSLDTGWAKGGLLALDAGSHLVPITRIMERDFPLAKRKVQDASVGNGFQTPGLSGSFSRTSLSPERQRVPDGYPEVDSDEETKPEPTIMSDGPFAGLKVPHASARANALYILQAH